MKWFVGIAVSLVVVFSLMFLLAESCGLTDQRLISGWLESIRDRSGSSLPVAIVIAGLLFGDLVLPVPSSVVMTLSGLFLGPWAGMLASFAGAMGAAFVGFGLCRKFGRRAFIRLSGSGEVSKVEILMERYGAWAIVLSRSVPMLTEVVSCLAGLSGMSFRRFILLSIAGTAPICAVYAWAGASSGETPTGIGWAVLLAFAIPAAGFALVRLLTRR